MLHTRESKNVLRSCLIFVKFLTQNIILSNLIPFGLILLKKFNKQKFKQKLVKQVNP